MPLDLLDLRHERLDRLCRLRVGVLDEVGAQLRALRPGFASSGRASTIVLMFSGKPVPPVALAASKPGRERIKELPILRRLGLDAGFVPVGRAVELGECPALDLRAGRQLELLNRHFQPHPLSRRGQVAQPRPLGRAVFAEVDQVRAPVCAVRPAPVGVPLKHQLFGRARRIHVNISKQRVSRAHSQLAGCVVEESLFHAFGPIAQGSAAAEDGMVRLFQEFPGAVSLRRGALRQRIVDPDELRLADAAAFESPSSFN